METIKTLLPFILKGSLAGVVFAIGLDATRDDILYFARRPGGLGRALLAISVIVPLAAMLVMRLLPLSAPAKAGVILMSLAPVPPFAPVKDLKAGGRKEYVYGLFATFALLSVVIVPITVAVLDKVYGTQVQLPVAALAKMVISTVLGPLVLGMVIKEGWPDLARRAAPWINRIAMVLLAAAAVLIVLKALPAILALIGNGMVLGIVAIVVVGIAGGHILGGPDPRDRATLAATAATRHPGIAMMVATAYSPDPKVAASIILFLLVALIVVSIYLALLKQAARRA